MPLPSSEIAGQLALQAMQDSPIGQILFDAVGKVMAWNAWMERASGIPAGQAIGRRLDEIFPELAGTPLIRRIESCLHNGQAATLSHLLHRRLLPLYNQERDLDGTPIRQQIFLVPLRLPDAGAFCQMQILDVTAAYRRDLQLAENERRLRGLIDAMPDFVCFKDGEGRWIEANNYGLELFQIDKQGFRGLTDRELAERHPQLQAGVDQCIDSDQAAWAAGTARRSDERFPRGDGNAYTFDVIKVPIFNADGSRQGLVVVGRDVTERKRAEEEQKLAAQVFAASNEAIMITDPQQRIVAVNPAFCQMTGYAQEEAIGKTPRLLHSARQGEFFYKELRDRLAQKGQWSGELVNRRKDGEYYHCWLSITTVRDAQGQPSHYVGIATDISERKAAEERIRHLAEHDFLTGLPNRILLSDRLRQAIELAKRQKNRLAVLFLDLDRFKSINDTLGHNIGDELLKVVARRLEDCVRSSDTVARLGGDEFIILLPGLDTEAGAKAVAEKILAALAEPIVIEGQQLHTGTSIGIAMYPADGENADVLMKHADLAMYRAKAHGRGTYEFHSASGQG